jgi:uncharacterized protein (TIGR03435 family)
MRNVLFLLTTTSIAVGSAMNTMPLRAQSAATDGKTPAFEVASVKPNNSGDFRRGMGPAPGGRFSAINVPLRELIAFAYGVPNARANLQVVGGPPWINTARFDVQAVAAGGAIPPGQAGPMVSAMLAERFKLEIHRESREVPIYQLVLDRGDKRLGTQLRPSAIDCQARRAARGRGIPPPAPQGPPPDPTTIRPTCGLRLTPGRFAGDAVPLSQLAEGLAPSVGRLIVDRTGLTGYFDLDLEWTPDQAGQPRPDGADTVADVDARSIFTALREQLGLQLEPTKGPVDVVVIDRVEHPSED